MGVAEHHAQNVRVNRVGAEKFRKMWCKCGASQFVAALGSPISAPCKALTWNFSGADDGIRTRDPHLGK